jgi:hypothetical protein
LGQVPAGEAHESAGCGRSGVLLRRDRLAIYFRSFVDFIAPIAIAIVASLVVVKMVGVGTELGWLAGAIIASLYGLSRSQDSNQRLDQAENPPVAPPGANVA